MRYLLLLLTLTSCSALSKAPTCPQYTHEQDRLIHLAYYTGAAEDLGYTLAAITIQESFVNKYIVRVNEKDRGYGSYGITMIQLSTAMWLEGETNIWRAKQNIVPKLMMSDAYALQLGINKLKSVGVVGDGVVKSYLHLWGRYNGGNENSPYARKIQKHVKMLQKCYEF